MTVTCSEPDGESTISVALLIAFIIKVNCVPVSLALHVQAKNFNFVCDINLVTEAFAFYFGISSPLWVRIHTK